VADENKWAKLEEIIRRVVREEVAALGSKAKLGFVNGKWTGVTSAQLEAWMAAYGAVDIDAELKKAAAWIVSNPHLAPKSQLGRFLNTWFARTQDRSSIRSIPSPSERVAAGPGKKLCSYCERVATNSPNRIWACDDHTHDAMDQKPVPMFKNAVTAKPVAGA
jgi:hypothetical protein